MNAEVAKIVSVAVGSELPQLGGYPFEVRYSHGVTLRPGDGCG